MPHRVEQLKWSELMSAKRTIPQEVFDNKENLKASKEGHRRACEELAAMDPWKLDASNPNHPFNDSKFMARQKT
jgi:hypothetical protein